MTRLFREEAIKAQSGRMLGDAIIAQPLSLRVFATVLTVFGVLLLVTTASATYTRKEVVTGYISPERGIVEVNASRSGFIERILAREGDVVQAGTPLLVISSTRKTDHGVNMIQRMIESIESQLREIDRLETLAVARQTQSKQRIRIAIDGKLAEQSALESQLAAQRELRDLFESGLLRLDALVTKGYVSAEQTAARRESLVTSKQRMAALAQQAAALDGEIRRQRALLESLPLDLERERSELRAKRSALGLQKLQIAEQGAEVVVAPIAGTISAGVVDHGDSVINSQYLLSLLPNEGRLEAHLLVPSRAIGFLETGQRVGLLYDTFDYKRYGAQEGRVVDISPTALSAAQTLQRIQRNEPTYRVRVALANQEFHAFGKRLTLQPGMTLRADVSLERRTILRWLADPVFALLERL